MTATTTDEYRQELSDLIHLWAKGHGFTFIETGSDQIADEIIDDQISECDWGRCQKCEKDGPLTEIIIRSSLPESLRKGTHCMPCATTIWKRSMGKYDIPQPRYHED